MTSHLSLSTWIKNKIFLWQEAGGPGWTGAVARHSPPARPDLGGQRPPGWAGEPDTGSCEFRANLQPAFVPPRLQSRGHRATPTLYLIRWLCHCGQRPPTTEGLGDWPCQPSPASVPRPTQRALWGKLEADRWVPGLSFGSSEEEASRQPLSALPEECQTLDPFPWFCFLHAFGFCFVFILKNIQFRVKGQG